LSNAIYWRKGLIKDYCKLVLGTPEDEPYLRETAISFYHYYNQSIIDYFRERQDDLLVLNVAEPDALFRLCDFLELPAPEKEFPWENRLNK